MKLFFYKDLTNILKSLYLLYANQLFTIQNIMKKSLFFVLVMFASLITYSQSKINITINYPDAQIYKMEGSTILQPAIGVGSTQLRLDKDETNKIIIIKEGFESVIQEFPKTSKWPKDFNINLENRVVSINAEPNDAQIYVGGTFMAVKKHDLIIRKGAIASVEIKKKGFKTIIKTFYNTEGNEPPPLIYDFKLEDRLVELAVTPADAEIYVNQKSLGIGSQEVLIPKGECVQIQAKKEGFILDEKVFCNKESENTVPLSYSFVLKDRLVKITSTPNDAEIKVGGKIVGIGNYDLKVPENKCVEVTISKESFLTIKKNYCNSTDYQVPPTSDHLELIEDEAYKTSISTDLANVNFTLDVRPTIPENEAWKLISSIVTTQFDVLEVTDKETGYLRTAWQVQSFNGKSTVRTRVIVKLGDSNPLRYIIKICSERADGVVSVKEDQAFEEWNRILKKYKDIISEAQSRL